MFRVFLPVTVTAALLIPLFFRVPNPLNNPLLIEVHEFSHTALFFVVELLLLAVMSSRWRLQPFNALLLASCISFAAGAGIEWIQPFFDRTSSMLDMQRNLLGIIAANCTWLAAQTYLGRTWRSAFLGVAVTTLIISGAGVYPWLIAQLKRDRAFPVIMDFRDPSLHRYVNGAADGELRITSMPGVQTEIEPVGRLFMPGDKQWPGMRITNPYPDWSDFRKLKFDVYLSDRQDAVLGLNIYSAQRKRKPWGYKAFKIEAGHNQLEFDLPAEPTSKEDITDFLIYSKSRDNDLTVYIANIRLE